MTPLVCPDCGAFLDGLRHTCPPADADYVELVAARALGAFPLPDGVRVRVRWPVDAEEAGR